MRKKVLLVVLFGLIAVGYGERIWAGVRNAFGFETISVTTTVQTLSTTYVTNPISGTIPDIAAYMTMETGDCRWRMDGTAPTASIGHKLSAGDSITIIGYDNLKNFKAILTGSTTGTLSISYER